MLGEGGFKGETERELDGLVRMTKGWGASGPEELHCKLGSSYMEPLLQPSALNSSTAINLTGAKPSHLIKGTDCLLLFVPPSNQMYWILFPAEGRATGRGGAEDMGV